MFQLALIFFLVPIIELYFLIKIGSIIGPFNTIMLVILTAVFGAYLAKREGLKTLYKIRENMYQGVMPTEELVDAFLIFIAGVLLLTPGLITDILGLCMLFPASRDIFKEYLKKWMKNRIHKTDFYIDL
ncbi:hypothetical protein JCM13304A_16140 [Desulfothermus okinawensis JCM 13304]